MKTYTHPLRAAAEKNRAGQGGGIYSVCSANELVLRAVIRHAVSHRYPLIIESTSNQVNQFGGYTGMRPHEFAHMVRRIAREERMDTGALILGGDHLGPLVWCNEREAPAMEKAAGMVRAYTLAGFGKIHLDTSMKLAGDDPVSPQDPRICARRGAVLAKAVEEAYAELAARDAGAARPVLVIGSEVPIPGGSRGYEDSVTPTKAEDFLRQAAVFREEFLKAGVSFDETAAFVVQPGVEFGDDFVCFYEREKAKPLTEALKSVPRLVFEGHSTDYQSREKLAEMVEDGVAVLKVGPAFTFVLREGLFLLEAIEKILIANAAKRSNFKGTLLDAMNRSDRYWKTHYTGTPEQIEYKKCYSYSDRCRYYLPERSVQEAINTLIGNLPDIPPALLSQYFPAQYRLFMRGALKNDARSLLYGRIGELCDDYAGACGFETGPVKGEGAATR
jgi:D-tagatose-1,6-bisphosphate aldolase subunit GatZ/KbaZ